MLKCHNCEKNAMYWVGPEGQELPLCLDCYIRDQDMCLRTMQAKERVANVLSAHLGHIFRMPNTPPLFPEPRPGVNIGDVVLNNIQVSNSEIGVLNTGTIQNVDATLTVLKQGADAELAEAIAAVSEAVIKCGEIAAGSKNEVLEFLYTISSQAVAPPQKRMTAVVKALVTKLSDILGGVGAVAGLWEKARAVLGRVFGF